MTEDSRYSAEQVARVCHAANRALQELAGDPLSPEWGALPTEQRASVLAGVALARQGTAPEALHRAWCQHRIAQGWQWGPVKDERAKRHPNLVPYGKLPPEQRIKDAVFSAIAQAMG